MAARDVIIASLKETAGLLEELAGGEGGEM